MILGVRGADELEPEQVAIGMRLGPHDLGMLDCLMVRRRAHAEGADLPHRNGRVHGDPQTANAGIDRQAGALHRPQQIDLGIERPTSRTAPRSTMDRDVSATLRKYRRESVGNGRQSTADNIETTFRWLGFSAGLVIISTRPAPFRRKPPPHLLACKPKQRERMRSISALRRPSARAMCVPYQKRSIPSTAATCSEPPEASTISSASVEPNS